MVYVPPCEKNPAHLETTNQSVFLPFCHLALVLYVVHFFSGSQLVKRSRSREGTLGLVPETRAPSSTP